ncbi:MAG: 2Fe-2S iron-sulfur cluster binding domain and protein [Dehalococcoidia bacterium]|nr:2Fe-2S iron-sulfur cluster binding domain and protein [Dehalococcoidia bacterium]
MPDELHTVEVLPSQKKVTAHRGSLLLDAAAKAGMVIDTPCGGQGRCGRCLVKVTKGQAIDHESPRLTPQQRADGWVLSCTARVGGDVSFVIPAQRERELIVVETATTRTAVPVQCDWPFYPTVRQFYAELPPPSLDSNAADLDRLQAYVAEKQGLAKLAVSPTLLPRLAATLREANWRVTLTVILEGGDQQARLIDISPGHKTGPLYAAAVDIGTTNVVIELVDLRQGKALGRVSSLNKQRSCGEDVISRIIYSERGNGLETLHRLVLETINGLLQEMAAQYKFDTRDIHQVTVAGNTTMIHLFWGLPATYLRKEPYTPTATFFPEVPASQLGININPNAPVYCLPAVAAYVGGDITAGVLSSCLFKSNKLTLFLDMGTNGEIVLGNSEWMTTCACSAGPAFEGGGVRDGMRAIDGAIEEIRINSKTLEPTLEVIGGVPPQGICGSGMITGLAEMLITGVVSRSGRMNLSLPDTYPGRARIRPGEHGAEYVLAWASESGTGNDIVLTEVDIDNLIRTKAAIYAGIAVMARNLGIPLDSIEEVLIGGAFGKHINIEAAIQIGLLPDLPWDKYRFLGNTSVWGAYNVLFSKYARQQVEESARKMTYFELIADASFMDELTAAAFLPHTNADLFPSVKEMLK